MTKKNLSPYLDQTLSVLGRTAGAPPSRIRAVGFLRQKLREGRPAKPAGTVLEPRARVAARDNPRYSDRG